MPSGQALSRFRFVLLLFPDALQSWVVSSNHCDEQVIAPFLIIQRIANRRALTSEVIVAGDPGSIQFKSPVEPTYGNRSFDGGSPTSSMYVDGEISRELGDGVKITIDKFTS